MSATSGSLPDPGDDMRLQHLRARLREAQPILHAVSQFLGIQGIDLNTPGEGQAIAEKLRWRLREIQGGKTVMPSPPTTMIEFTCPECEQRYAMEFTREHAAEILQDMEDSGSNLRMCEQCADHQIEEGACPEDP